MSIIKVENLTFSYNSGYNNIFENVSFQLDTDWKLGFVGRNGRGKTTFLNLLQDKYEYDGKIISSAQFDYFPYYVADKSVVTQYVLESVCPTAEDWQIIRELSYLDVDSEILYRPFNTLSNGEQTKALLAALFLNEGHFLLIDEPTNHLDTQARELLSKYLKRKKGFILVSHDRSFLDGCVDHILSLNKTNIEVQSGNFTSFWTNSNGGKTTNVSKTSGFNRTLTVCSKRQTVPQGGRNALKKPKTEREIRDCDRTRVTSDTSRLK